MFVYGVRCSAADVTAMVNSGCPVVADYYMDHGLLVFPDYTKTTCIAAMDRSRMNTEFWDRVNAIATGVCREMDIMEHPYITDEEAEALNAIRDAKPDAVSAWYFLPETMPPMLCVTDADISQA